MDTFDKKLGYYLENEDIDGIMLINKKYLSEIDQQLVDHIISTGRFSAEIIAQELSMEHAIRYMTLCNNAMSEMKEALDDQIIKLKNDEELMKFVGLLDRLNMDKLAEIEEKLGLPKWEG